MKGDANGDNDHIASSSSYSERSSDPILCAENKEIGSLIAQSATLKARLAVFEASHSHDEEKPRRRGLSSAREISASALMYISEGSFGKFHAYPFNSRSIRPCWTPITAHNCSWSFTFDGVVLLPSYCEAHEAVGRTRTRGGFSTPQAWQFWQPARAGSESKLLTPESIPRSPSGPAPTRRSFRQTAPKSALLFSDFQMPTISIDLIPSMHPFFEETYRTLFWCQELRIESVPVRLLRLYFGREDIPSVTTALQKGLKSDPPLDIARFEKFSHELTRHGINLPSVQEIAEGMGFVLAKLHWVVGINARDVELVLGGDGSHDLKCYALDFNQCQRWLLPYALDSATKSSCPTINLTYGQYALKTLLEGVKRLGQIIAGQELYYPRPHQTEVYEDFKRGYLATVASVLSGYGEARERDGVNETAEAWSALAEAVKLAAEGFFEESEKVDAEKMARRGTRRGLVSEHLIP